MRNSFVFATLNYLDGHLCCINGAGKARVWLFSDVMSRCICTPTNSLRVNSTASTLDDMVIVLREVFRILAPSGIIILGFIERDKEIFWHYHAEPEKGRFLRHARFYSSDEVIKKLHEAGFSSVEVNAREHGFCVLSGKKKMSPIS